MRRFAIIFAILGMAILTTSCFKDEPLNSECDILSAWVEGAEYEPLFFHTSQMRVDDVASNASEIVFLVRSTLSLPALPVQFTITDGATIEPASGSLQDFSQGPVTYTVTSQDGEWSRTYTVSFREADMPSFKYSFEHARVDTSQNGSCTFHVFYELDAAGEPRNIWASGNEGVALVQSGWTPDQFPTRQSDAGYQGKCLCLCTQYAGALGEMMHKPIAAGSLFIGSFDLMSVLTNPLGATRFGTPIDKCPVKVTGWYKYQPGAEFTDASMNVIADRVDEASIYAVFYRNQDAQGNSVTLDGTNTLTSEYIVRKAQVSSLPATNEWARFEMVFDNGAVDPEVLASMGYNFTLVFSSSKGGDVFEGAIGSTLYIDEVEVSFEE